MYKYNVEQLIIVININNKAEFNRNLAQSSNLKTALKNKNI